ncbi:MAG TPA: PAS sensor domain-containing protein [Gammaproteobacteria bacterium]|jgi:PAS domain S-box-containing protein|nr:PAS sensor domain-containing protein [Gammaproteobacteria bacterium]
MSQVADQDRVSEQVMSAIESVLVISKTDLLGNITYANDLFCKLTGYAREELIGEPHNLVRHKDVPKAVYKDMWDTIKRGDIWTGVIPNVGKDGSVYIVDTTVQPVVSDDGEVKEYISIRRVINDLMSDFDSVEFSKDKFDEYYA